MLKMLRKWNDPILSKVCEPVTDMALACQIAQDLRDTLKKHKIGVGMAAPQIGYLHRVILIMNDVIMINPEIIDTDGEQPSIEGCLSYPNVTVKVKRPAEITVKYLDEDMEERTAVLDGYQAIVCCHEMDHLDGNCIVKKSRRSAA